MNGSEGLRRLAVVIRRVGAFIALLIAVGGVAGAMGVERPPADSLVVAVVFAIIAAIVYAAARALAWIIEGFGKPRS